MPKKDFNQALDNRRSGGTTLGYRMPANLVPDDPLRYDYGQIDPDVRDQVILEVQAIKLGARTMRDAIVNIGQRLISLKSLVEHGQFEDICSQEFGLHERTAQHWMNVARTMTPEQVRLFGDNNALYLLAAPSTAPETRQQVIEAAQTTGQPISRQQAKAAREQQRQPKTPPAATLSAAPPPAPPEPDTVDGTATIISDHEQERELIQALEQAIAACKSYENLMQDMYLPAKVIGYLDTMRERLEQRIAQS